jgi:hypothetical protein
MIRRNHILWRLKQLLLDPKRAISGRFRRTHKTADLEIWEEPSYFDQTLRGIKMSTRNPDGSWTVDSYDEKGRKTTKWYPFGEEPPL